VICGGSPSPSSDRNRAHSPQTVIWRQVLQKQADEFAATMLPIIDAIRARWLTTLAAIADELMRQKWPTARGGEVWTTMAVWNILKRTANRNGASHDC
jgi:hypothetical protein